MDHPVYRTLVVVHCRSKEEAERLLEQMKERFMACKLELHPDNGVCI
jgi:hypothetical protein